MAPIFGKLGMLCNALLTLVIINEINEQTLLSLSIYIHMSQYILQQLGAITALIISSLHFFEPEEISPSLNYSGICDEAYGEGISPKDLVLHDVGC